MIDMNKEEAKVVKSPAFRWRAAVSIIAILSWLAFIVIWLFFYADNFTIYQNVAVFFASILVIGVIKSALWAPWGMKYGPSSEKKHHKKTRKKK